MEFKKLFCLFFSLNIFYFNAHAYQELEQLAEQLANKLLEEKDSKSLQLKTKNLSPQLEKTIHKKLVENNLLLLLKNEEPTFFLSGHIGAIKGITFSSNEKKVIIISQVTTIIWDLNKDIISGKIVEDYEPGLNCAAFNHDDTEILKGYSDNPKNIQALAAASTDNENFILYVKNNRYVEIEKLEDKPRTFLTLDHTLEITAASFKPNKKIAFTGDINGDIYFWNYKNELDISHQILSSHSARIRSIALSFDTHYLLSGSNDKTAVLWNLKQNPIDAQVLYRHTDKVLSVALSSNNRFAITGSKDGTAIIWDLHKNPIEYTVFQSPIEVRSNEPLIIPITAVAFSPYCKYIITGTSNSKVRLWDISFDHLTLEELIIRIKASRE